MNRLPRKKKKLLKKMFLYRYGVNWNIFKHYDRNRMLIEYQWFFNNPFNWNMNIKLNKY